MANITKVYLLAAPMEKDYVHTLYFGSASAQQTYFQSKIKKSYTDFSYQRKDGVIRVPEHIDDLIAAGCNYVMYQNSAYSNRWFYAFIESMEYINDSRTDVKIRTDCIQTWMFDITVKPSFVEREHAASDNIGEHTIDESLETGEYVVQSNTYMNLGSDLAIVIGTTEAPDGKKAVGNIHHGVYSGLDYYAFDDGSLTDVSMFLIDLAGQEGAADAVQCMFLAPKVLCHTYEVDDPMHGKFEAGKKIGVYPQPYSVIINKVESDVAYNQEITYDFSSKSIQGYTPRNNKLLTYPFKCLLVSNNAGASAVYKYENFYKINGTTGEKTIFEPSFAMYGVLTVGCSVRLIPLYYNGSTKNEDEGINLGKYPSLNWTSDYYINWLTQNAVNIGLQMGTGAAQVVAGIAMAAGSGGVLAGIGGGTVVGGLTTISNTLVQKYQNSLVPPQSKGNLNSGDVTCARGMNTFIFYDMTVKREFAEYIDEYFDMFGYKCNRVKVPEKNHRENYWYTKTIDVNIDGSIPQEDLQVIKDCYNRGITFWKTPANFGNYSVQNGIV